MGIFFVTDRADAHIDRFFSLFLEISPSAKLIRVTYEDSDLPTAVIGESQFKSWASISEALSGSGSLVVSGPLDSVSSNLLVDGSAHVCISFASDVMLGLSNSEDVASRLEQLIPSAACVVTDNYATENALIAFGFTPEQILRIPWGPENDQETGFSSREALGWPESSKIVLYPRSLEPLYDPEVFLQGLSEVVQTHPKLIAVVIEAGSLVNLVKSRIQELGLEKNVIWHGLQTDALLRRLGSCNPANRRYLGDRLGGDGSWYPSCNFPNTRFRRVDYGRYYGMDIPGGKCQQAWFRNCQGSGRG